MLMNKAKLAYTSTAEKKPLLWSWVAWLRERVLSEHLGFLSGWLRRDIDPTAGCDTFHSKHTTDTKEVQNLYWREIFWSMVIFTAMGPIYNE